MQEWTVIARVLRPQGRRGEVLAEVLTDFPERFADRKNVVLLRENSNPTPAVIEAHWFPTGRNAGKVVLQFAGTTNISDAEALAGLQIAIPDSERVMLEEGAFYVSDLVGCSVTEEDHTLGTVRDVHFATDAHGRRIEKATPILVIERQDGDELLVPLAKAYLHKPDIPNKRLEMRLPPGLLDING
ncbi:MAG: 16S rRNA processing protein RimM [Acidobacteria bacterium]|nr:16S rRNA processing protein RimM [Acidobacteriota bacterium]